MSEKIAGLSFRKSADTPPKMPFGNSDSDDPGLSVRLSHPSQALMPLAAIKSNEQRNKSLGSMKLCAWFRALNDCEVETHHSGEQSFLNSGLPACASPSETAQSCMRNFRMHGA